MANYFTHVSLVIKGSKERANYLNGLIEAFDEFYDGSVDEERMTNAQKVVRGLFVDSKSNLDIDNYIGLELESQVNKDGEPEISIIGPEAPNIFALEKILQHYLQNFSIDSYVAFQWSDTCDKMRADGFGGGASLITKDEIRSINTNQWLHEQVSKLELSSSEKSSPHRPKP